ncbi:hypothetical protein GGR52DRAFT_592216 [Hypoxylon sp. FL1284]|nr:hypothetical protein GGR52DRAFT_592216 [Hypoxylon sp. FL1284]
MVTEREMQMHLPKARRVHHKSRNGCATCKTKRIKCDERRPRCSYCDKRRLPCSLAPLPSPDPSTTASASTPEAKAAQRQRPYDEEAPSFTAADFRLFRHFAQSTAVALADDEASVLVWRDVVSDLAPRHPYLLHELLATAALHLRTTVDATEQASLASSLEQTAAEHQARAIPLFREALAARPAEEAAVPLFACSCLFVGYHFAAARDPASLLFSASSPGALAEWLVLVQGCGAVTMQHRAAIMGSALRALLGDLHTPAVADLSGGSTDARLVELGHELELMQDSPERAATYTHIMVRLRVCFYLSDMAESVLDRKNAALRFPPLMSQAFTDDLGRRSPAALVVMAFWCVLLHRVEDRWWLKGRVRPLILKIEELVPPGIVHLMQWPLEQVGG